MSADPRARTRALVAGLYAVTPDVVETSGLVAKVAAAIAGGALAVQFRNKIASPSLQREQALALRAVCKAREVTFIINDDVDLAFDVGADGVHLGRDDATVAVARERLGSSRLIGASCYDSLQLAEAAVAAGADYIAFGSFFPSVVKPAAVRADVAMLAEAKARWPLPVVAIGGI